MFNDNDVDLQRWADKVSKSSNSLYALLLAAGLPFAAQAQTTPAPTPYSGVPIAIPGAFEAENFDFGGEGVAYHDNTPGNQGGQYRLSEDVDITVSTDSTDAGSVGNIFNNGERISDTSRVGNSAI